MRTQTLITLSILAFATAHASANDSWSIDYREIKKSSVASKRPTLVLFTNSHSCRHCIVAEKNILSQKETLEFLNENFNLIRVDFKDMFNGNKKTSEQIVSEAHLPIKPAKTLSWPNYLIIDAAGKKVFQSELRAEKTPAEFIAKISPYKKRR